LKSFSSTVDNQRLRLAFLPEMRFNLHVVSSSFNPNSNDRSTFSKLSLYRFLNLHPRVRVEVMCQMWAEEHDVFLHCRNVDKVRLRYSLEFEDTAALTACIDCLH